ncbi:MAG: pyridoxamine 5'-phosphate oxidase family protein [Pseudomonadota bacterium]
MSDPGDLTAFWDEAWQHLMRGAADSRSPARYPAFGTVSPDGVPEVRTVALRSAAPSTATLEVHTDTQTAKIAALQARPVAALHVWLPKPKVQIRVTADVRIQTGDAVEEAWSRVPEGSRVSYGTRPDPGTPIDAVFDYEKPPERARFAVLTCAARYIDLVHLGTPHRRAGYSRSDSWRGSWLAP